MKNTDEKELQRCKKIMYNLPETKIKRSVKIMKERYEALELNIVKIPVEDTIMMSGLDNNGDVGDMGGDIGGEDLGF